MSVDEVNCIGAMEFTYAANDACEKKSARAGEPEASWQCEVAQPMCRLSRRRGMTSPTVKGLHCKNGVSNSKTDEGVEWFGDKASGGVITVAWIKRR